MEELTQTQIFMIGKINEAIADVKTKMKTANDAEKPKLRIRLKQLEDQLENAKKPVHRTEKEKELINKMADKIKENADVVAGDKIEGTKSDTKLTPKEDFKYKLTAYVNDNKNKIVELKKVIAVQEEVLQTLEAHEPVSEEPLYKQNVNQIKDNILKLKVSVKSMEDRVNNAGIIEEVIENYDLIKRFNIFLGNVLGLADYEEYAEEIKKELEEK